MIVIATIINYRCLRYAGYTESPKKQVESMVRHETNGKTRAGFEKNSRLAELVLIVNRFIVLCFSLTLGVKLVVLEDAYIRPA